MAEPIVTDEELAYWEAAGVVHARENHMRLIAALRAERQQVATLKARLESCERMRETSRLRAEALEREVGRCG